MRIRLFLSLLFMFSITVKAQKNSFITVANLKCDYRINPVGVDSETPHFNWQILSDRRNVMQSAYHILVADNVAALKNNVGNIWDSGKINSQESIQITYKGKKLKAAEKYFWKVKVWDNDEKASEWSEPATWQMGLLTLADWSNAKWIGYEDLPASKIIVPAIHGAAKTDSGSHKEILPLLRKAFIVTKTIKQATMFISGLGHFEMRLNGQKIGDHFLDPGWTDYDKHAIYVGFDLTNNLVQGENAIGIMLGNGFYHIPQERYRKITGSFGYPKMICRLFIQYQDGTSENIISDASWKTAPGPITFTSIYGGEDYDARLEQAGWDKPAFQDASWKYATRVNGPLVLDAQTSEPLKVFENFKPVKITQPKPGIWVYDFGQNASGIPEISVTGNEGSAVRIIPGELLDDNGMVTQQATGGPSYFVYTLKGTGTETWRPQFTYYGFRYLQIEGGTPEGDPNLLKAPVIKELKGLHTRNSARTVGQFRCSSELFNKTYKLIDWAIRSNMASVMTDCPHREKLGWLEEAHLMGNSVRCNYDVATLFQKIISDMKYAQLDNGLVPDIAPEYVEFEGGFRDSPEWGSSAVIVPWNLYQWYGDKHSLEYSYPMMQRYVDYLNKQSKNHILLFGLGDWFDIGPKGVGESQLTPKGLTSTALFYYDLDILIKTAHLLGKTEDEKKYSLLRTKVKTAFNHTFFNKATKEYGTGSQTANAMAIYMNLVEPQFKNDVTANLIKDIRSKNNTITTGEIGFSYLLRVLEEAGRSDIIFDMNSRSDVPGYGYQLAHGATALTESWQAYRFVSNNHFMLGHLMEWFYSGLGGIRPTAQSIAFNKIDIRPVPVGNITMAKASYNSPYGTILSDWKMNGNTFELNVEVPPNTTATVYLPARIGSKVFENDRKINNKVINIGSGKYRFILK